MCNLFRFFLLILLVTACSSRLKNLNHYDFKDTYSRKDLLRHLRLHREALSKQKIEFIKIDHLKVSRSLYIESLRDLEKHLISSKEFDLEAYIKDKFYLIEVKGDHPEYKILLTSYYSPVLKGKTYPTKKYSSPVRKKPQLDSLTRAELTAQKVFPTEEVICYLDPIDHFFLQVQGSGTIHLGSTKKINVVYEGSNGHPYTSIGKYLVEKGQFKKEEMNLTTLEDYLRRLNSQKLNELLNQNQSYIYFRISEKPFLTTFGVEAIPLRTIATDGALFSKGLLAILDYAQPEVRKNKIEYKHVSRIVFDQDTGSAIKGRGRVDLYWGIGEVAKLHAGHVKTNARLIYLVPKTSNLNLN